MRVLVCGGRDFTNRDVAWAALDAIHEHVAPIDTIIHGHARGADALAMAWAVARGVAWLGFAADWSTYGRSAGPRRNQRMLDEGRPQLVLQLPGGRGTADMVGRARRAAVRVIDLADLDMEAP